MRVPTISDLVKGMTDADNEIRRRNPNPALLIRREKFHSHKTTNKLSFLHFKRSVYRYVKSHLETLSLRNVITTFHCRLSRHPAILTFDGATSSSSLPVEEYTSRRADRPGVILMAQ